MDLELSRKKLHGGLKMGGYGSGRRVRCSLISECLPVDTSFLLKRKMLTGGKQGGKLTFTIGMKDIKGKVTETKHNLSCLVERYGEEEGEFSKVDAAGHLTLRYGIKRGDTPVQPARIEVAMVTTQPHFGGQRWWFLAPCCGRRVRILYLPVSGEQIRLECRQCLNLNYVSQRQSYIERHKAYERHLLANYGYWWAQEEYRNLKEHYFRITLEWEYIRARSVFDRELEIMNRLIRCQRMLLRDDIQKLSSLKSEEDRQLYLDFLLNSRGKGYIIDMARMLHLDVTESEKAFEEEYMQMAAGDEDLTVMTPEQLSFYLKYLIERKRDMERELERLV